MVAKRSARHERTQAINQARALILTGPDELRARFAGLRPAALAGAVAALRPRPGDAAGYPLRVALRGARPPRGVPRRLGRPAERADRAAGHRPGAGPAQPARRRPGHRRPAAHRRRATTPGGCAARPPGRTCARSRPIPASSGKTRRHRLNRGGNREANLALWRIVITRMSTHPATRAYVTRRTAEGLSKKDIIRCLKRYVAREACPYLRG